MKKTPVVNIFTLEINSSFQGKITTFFSTLPQM